MFANRFFAKRYYPQRYFPQSSGTPPPTTGDTGFLLLLGVGRCLTLFFCLQSLR